MPDRRYRAGDSLEDVCRVCKTDRMHTVIAADPDGRPLRVSCGYCGSEHNYRGGPQQPSLIAAGPANSTTASSSGRAAGPSRVSRDPWPLVSDRERSAPPVTIGSGDVDLELLLRKVIREETGLTMVVPAEKWRGGSLLLRPGTAGLQDKSWPIETFFHKIVMVRNRLRTLEQQINAMEMPEDAKVRLQGYITGCYGSLTSFNVLFADDADQFKGTGD
jgi:hypothetical protein